MNYTTKPLSFVIELPDNYMLEDVVHALRETGYLNNYYSPCRCYMIANQLFMKRFNRLICTLEPTDIMSDKKRESLEDKAWRDEQRTKRRSHSPN